MSFWHWIYFWIKLILVQLSHFFIFFFFIFWICNNIYSYQQEVLYSERTKINKIARCRRERSRLYISDWRAGWSIRTNRSILNSLLTCPLCDGVRCHSLLSLLRNLSSSFLSKSISTHTWNSTLGLSQSCEKGIVVAFFLVMWI